MPAQRPRASFEPIPTDFDVKTFVETSDNFQYVDRISYEMIEANGIEKFEKLVLLHVVVGGKPLVIDGFEEILDPWTFTPGWLRDNHGEKVEYARNLTAKDNMPLTIKHYLNHMGRLTEQFFTDPEAYRDKKRQRIYLKDIDCPPVWQDKLKEHIPAGLFYLNESTGDIGGPGALDEPGGRKGRGIGRAGDLMSSLPPDMRAENLMCYIGHEGTYTPAHREMCASLGQNIMVNASGNIGEDGQPERPGSSIWFMTETKDRHLVSEYWLSVLGHDIEVEDHFAQLIAWKKAPFTTYVVEQRPGDFILIPPLAPHQVWNRGTRTMKIAWNRTTVETLELALSEALPNSRVVCRDEQYKNKAIVYYTLLKYSNILKMARAQVEAGGDQADAIQRSVKVRQVQRDFKRLFDLYKDILLSEMFAPDSREHPEYVPYDSNVTCSYCRCNIFNRFLTCKTCKNAYSKEIDDPYDVCMDCYCMGRSCSCQSGYTWVEQFKWKDLVHKYEEWRAQIIDIDGRMTEKTPLPLMEERRYLGRKTLAQVCQEQLKLRPFVDPNAPPPEEDEKSDDDEVQFNADGTVRRMGKKKSKAWLNNHRSCHFCLHRHPKWKMAFCTNCDLAYCYGTLFRAHDKMPLSIMENPNWKCPHCERKCNTGACRRDPRQHPYKPKGTLLGHDTKKVADPRSVECLVDFSVSNLNWLQEDGAPMQQRRLEAEQAKMHDPMLDDRFMDEEFDYSNRNGIAYSPVQDQHAGANANEFGDRNGYVDPNAVVYQADTTMQEDGFNNSYYPDPDQNGEIPRLGKRNRDDGEGEAESGRRKKKKKQAKKDETNQPAQPKNVSGKEYQKEVQKRLLEEARRDDRYITVLARMKNKSKVVKLSLRPELLEEVRRRPVRPHPQAPRPEAEPPVGDVGSILESDVLPAPNAGNKPTEKPKLPTSFRVRVDDDEAYGTRRRDSHGNTTSKPGRRNRKGGRFEELTLDSDDEEFEEEDMVEYSGPSMGRPRGEGRSSAWLARKHQDDDEDLPSELPPDFRDGTVRRRERDRQRDAERRERRKTMPAKGKAGIRLPGRPSRKSTGNMSDEDGIHEDDDTGDSALALAAAAALEASKRADEEERKKKEEEERARLAAEREAEENLRAKMALWDEDGEGIDGIIEGFAADDEPLHDERANGEGEESLFVSASESPEAVRTGPPLSENSIFSRPGMAGKKIKIVSSTKRNSGAGPSATAATTASTATTSTAANVLGSNLASMKERVTVDLSDFSDSDSEDEIPATAAAAATPKRGPGRPPGSGRVVPSRGGAVVGKRGRGRPRKSVG
ncbi:uncharacterized protein EI97DRAFT_430730 [Westerdykella ornata]|uniref:JmjC domain-containing protein n=1 Tax=Westerdykella ornata TaxID=318751 RepID=A0A6A6JXA9_WESOR|nr:uncharacterized protein EI97DRAFT_430730 [Westerdykella ornata]KAF2279699.1 hypothetical protein EI97DRAFT_430730 [Westerdykella ornata]